MLPELLVPKAPLAPEMELCVKQVRLALQLCKLTVLYRKKVVKDRHKKEQKRKEEREREEVI